MFGVVNLLDRMIRGFGLFVAWGLLPPLILMRAYDIVAKQFFAVPSALFQVLEWNAFFLLALLTIGFTYLQDGHVRIDVVRDRLSARAKAWIEIVGFLFACLPFCLVLIFYGGQFAMISYGDQEPWLFPGVGLWLKKAMLPFGGLLLLTAGTLTTARNALFLYGRAPSPAPNGD